MTWKCQCCSRKVPQTKINRGPFSCECGTTWKRICINCFNNLVIQRYQFSKTSVCCANCYKHKLKQLTYPRINDASNILVNFLCS